MSLDALTGRTYGPYPVDAGAGAVGRFVAATGDDQHRWAAHAPPMFINTALFRAAPVFLDDPVVAPYTRSLIHTEQRFAWMGPLAVGAAMEVTGEVAAVRARGELNFVTFEVSVTAQGAPWATGVSTFLMSQAAAASGDPEPEPSQAERAANDSPGASALPPAGETLPPVARSASRADLVRYAAATGDFNPIHWDHDAAVAAGLPGIVVHGLLMGAWVATAASGYSTRPDPLASLRLRFRAPLRPAVAASVVGTVAAVDDDGADLPMSITTDGGDVVTANVRVTG